MKIRWDFVTNSSTTSFLIICKGKPKINEFMIAMGVKEKKSPLWKLFNQLYNIMIDKIEPIGDAVQKRHWEKAESVYDLVKTYFSETTAKRVESAIRNSKDVWIGRLSSDEGDVESFFCVDDFEVEHGDFYLNALPCIW